MSDRCRARELGIAPGAYPPGPLNSIVDVPGVRVGHTTLDNGADIRTGVTAIVPDQLLQRGRLTAGLFVGNGYGKLVGATQVAELGEIETPILLTGTLSAFRVADALVTYMLGLPGNDLLVSVNPVVGETNDGYLSDIRSRPVTETEVLEAIRTASSGMVSEGCVGAGTGVSALGYKAGIGAASRMAPVGKSGSTATIGVLVQANFGGRLQVDGISIRAEEALLGVCDPDEPQDAERGNSCMIVAATDANLDSRQLTRLATRAVFGMARVGASFSHGSGDYGIAFSAGDGPDVSSGEIDTLFAAVQDATEEALLNSLFMATTTVGIHGRVRHAVPLDFVRERLSAR